MKNKNISKKRITLGTKQFVPMFEQFLNESEEMEDEDMEMEETHGKGGEDEDMGGEEEEMEGSESGEGFDDESEEEEKEVEERIQEAYRRGLAKGRKLGKINEDSPIATKGAAASQATKSSTITKLPTGWPVIKMDETTEFLRWMNGLNGNGWTIKSSAAPNLMRLASEITHAQLKPLMDKYEVTRYGRFELLFKGEAVGMLYFQTLDNNLAGKEDVDAQFKKQHTEADKWSNSEVSVLTAGTRVFYYSNAKITEVWETALDKFVKIMAALTTPDKFIETFKTERDRLS